MAAGIIEGIKELEKKIKGSSKGINKEIWELLIRQGHKQNINLEGLLREINKIVFKMRCKGQNDEATALEILINLFLNKKYCAYNQYQFAKLQQNISIILMLVNLESTGAGRKMTELSWKLLKYAFKVSKQEYLMKSPKDLFEEGITLYPESIEINAKDYFNHHLGYLQAAQGTETRFSSFSYEIPRIEEQNALTLGTFNFEQKASTWFEQSSGELMGAFLHVQIQDKSNPFNLSLKLPRLNTEENNIYDFPFPCIPTKKQAKPERKTPKKKVDWVKVTENIQKNRNLPEFIMEKTKKLPLWESSESPENMQHTFKDLDISYEKSLLSSFDSSYTPTLKPMDKSEFMRNVKNLILSIPNKLYDINTYKVHSRFRLESHSHIAIHDFLTETLSASQSYKFLLNLTKELEKKKERIGPCFAKGIKQILEFFENFILHIPNDLTLIQFNIQTQSLREQIESLRIVCTDLPSGYKLIDYLYVILTKNEGDFENYHLLQRLFKRIFQPVLESLTEFVQTAEVNDIFNEFFVKENRNVISQAEFSLDKYFNGYSFAESLVFDPIKDSLMSIGRNMRLLKELGEDLSCYYQLLSTGTLSSLETMSFPVPKLRISYKPFKINKIVDDFIAFNAEKTRCILNLERKIIEEEQEKLDLITEKRQKQLTNTKLISTAQQKLQAEKVQEKTRKQWAFYQTLENQLKENQELKRITEEKRIADEKQAQENNEMNQKALIEQGKKYLMDKHEELLSELYFKKARENWRNQRKELQGKRKVLWEDDEKLIQALQDESQKKKVEDIEMKSADGAFKQEGIASLTEVTEILLSQEAESLKKNEFESFSGKNNEMQIDRDPEILLSKEDLAAVDQENENPLIKDVEMANSPLSPFSDALSLKPSKSLTDYAPDIENNSLSLLSKNSADIYKQPEDMQNYFPVKIKQPPGGFSTIQELFSYNFTPDKQPEIIDRPRIGYNEDLEKLEICSALLYDEIIKKVFRKITPIKTWEIPEKHEGTHPFESLFPDFPEQIKRNKELLIPFTKVVEKLIIDPIRVHCEIVDKATVHLILRKLKLMDHLKALKRYALLEAGDTIDLFLNTIFSNSFSGNMTAAWEGCLKMTSSKDDEYGDFFRISIKDNSLYRIQFKTVEDLEFLKISYNIKGPLSLVISPDRVQQYSRAFCNLLRVKHVTGILSNIKMFRVPPSHVYFRKIHLLRQKMQHFLDIYQGYIASELHGSSWKFLTKGISQAKSLSEIISIHKQYLDLIMARCFVEGKGTVVMEQLKMIFQLVMRFRNIILELDEFSLREIETIEDDFNRIHRFLFKMTQTMATKGNYPELFLRLDFNEFMTHKIELEKAL